MHACEVCVMWKEQEHECQSSKAPLPPQTSPCSFFHTKARLVLQMSRYSFNASGFGLCPFIPLHYTYYTTTALSTLIQAQKSSNRQARVQ